MGPHGAGGPIRQSDEHSGVSSGSGDPALTYAGIQLPPKNLRTFTDKIINNDLGTQAVIN